MMIVNQDNNCISRHKSITVSNRQIYGCNELGEVENFLGTYHTDTRANEVFELIIVNYKVGKVFRMPLN